MSIKKIELLHFLATTCGTASTEWKTLREWTKYPAFFPVLVDFFLNAC